MSDVLIHDTYFSIDWPAAIIVAALGLGLVTGVAWVLTRNRRR